MAREIQGWTVYIQDTHLGSKIFIGTGCGEPQPLVQDMLKYQGFIPVRGDIPHEVLQDFVVIDYTQRVIILAVLGDPRKEAIAGIEQYGLNRV